MTAYWIVETASVQSSAPVTGVAVQPQPAISEPVLIEIVRTGGTAAVLLAICFAGLVAILQVLRQPKS